MAKITKYDKQQKRGSIYKCKRTDLYSTWDFLTESITTSVCIIDNLAIFDFIYLKEES